MNQKDCADWIKEDKYKDSIYNVISNAIADCVLKRNEFAKKKMKDGVVTFENDNYAGYLAENWNALVLYNLVRYVYSLKKNKKPQDGGKSADAMNVASIREEFLKKYIDGDKEDAKLQVKCGTDYKDKIKWAYNDIMEYDTALSIIEYMISEEFDNIWDIGALACADYEKNGLADIEINSNDLYNNSYAFNNSDEKAESGKSDMRIIVRGGKVADAVVYGAKAMYNCDLDDYMNIEYKTKVQEYKYPKDVFSSEQMESLYRKEEESGTETDVDVSPEKTMITEGLIALWYEEIDFLEKIKNDHLNWILPDTLYTKKSYITPTKKINLIFCTINEGEFTRGIILDEACLEEISLPSYKNSNKCQEYLDIGLKMKEGTYIETDAKCKRLISKSNSITGIDLTINIGWNSDNKQMPKIIEGNQNLRKIKLKINDTWRTKCKGMIKGNPQLKEIDLELNAYKLDDLGGMISQNDNLEKVTINFENATENHNNVSNMITSCGNLNEVHLKNTKTTDEYGYTKSDVYTDVLLNGDDAEEKEEDEAQIFPGCPKDVIITIDNK